MNSLTDGGPAFPIPDTKYGTPPGHQGMSLRDWFAGQALMGLISSSNEKHTGLEYAAGAYNVADAMLEARKK